MEQVWGFLFLLIGGSALVLLGMGAIWLLTMSVIWAFEGPNEEEV